jgi:predicted transcriptional regulator
MVIVLGSFDKKAIYYSVMSNESRQAIVYYLLTQVKGDYLSGIAKKLGQNRGAVFRNLNALHDMGALRYEWRVVKGNSPPKLVKYYYVNPRIPTDIREDLETLTHLLQRLLK